MAPADHVFDVAGMELVRTQRSVFDWFMAFAADRLADSEPFVGGVRDAHTVAAVQIIRFCDVVFEMMRIFGARKDFRTALASERLYIMDFITATRFLLYCLYK